MNAAALPISQEFLSEIEEDVSTETIRLMTRVVLLANENQQQGHARVVVDGLQRPFSQYLSVGMVSVSLALAEGRHSDAMKHLDALAKDWPGNDLVLCACAVLKKELGASGWRDMARKVVERASDDDATRIARELLGASPASAETTSRTSAHANTGAVAALRFS
jgi:hypothetical protein